MKTKKTIAVTIERRPDGGLRAWSEDAPGLVLSNSDADAVLEDLQVALKSFGSPE